jgi:hypothetical protein
MQFMPPDCHPTLEQQAQTLRQIQYDQTYVRKELATLREALEKRTTNLFRLQLGAITLTGALGFGAELLGSLPPL